MANTNSSFVGKNFSCPGCQSNLKFTRAPKSLLQKCPNCRRKLRLQEKEAAASQDDLLKEAIDSLVDWEVTSKKAYNYRVDPILDQCVCPEPNVWKFDQPWPKNTGEILLKNSEVVYYAADGSGSAKARELLMNGTFKRVTAFRTGQVEELEVTGHWYDVHPYERKVGVLPRKVVRELNLIPEAKKFAARINTIELVVEDAVPVYKLFIDLAIDTTPAKRSSRRRI